MAGAYGFDSSARWSAVKVIVASDADITIQAAPGAGRTLMVQGITWIVTTAAAQAYDFEDTGASPVEIFKAPASHAVGPYSLDYGPLGVALTANTGLEFDCAAAGVAMTVSAFGYIKEA